MRAAHCPAPRTLRAFPNAVKASSKTPIQGGVTRKRWKDDDGTIHEWDPARGAIEKYDGRGHRQGEFDPDDGKRLEPAPVYATMIAKLCDQPFALVQQNITEPPGFNAHSLVE